jgi:Ca2+-binding RTX toxin-like protein
MRRSPILSLTSACVTLFVLSMAACSGGGGNASSSAGGPAAPGDDGGSSGGSSSGGSSSGGSSSGGSSSGGSSSGGSSSGGSSSGGSSSGGSSGTPNPERCTAPAADYQGVDTSKVPAGTAPTGCVKGYDSSSRTMTVTLASGATAMISGKNGEVTINGVACTNAQGVTAKTAEAKSIVIEGTSGAETVIVDLSGGPLTALLVDLQGGTDTFVIQGSANADAITSGNAKAGLAFDWSGDLMADAIVAGGESFTVSTGPGDDTFRGGGAKTLGDPANVVFTVYGGAGNDTLEGGTKSDALCGGAGDDTFFGGAAASGDQFDGADGNDTVRFDARVQAVAVTMDDVANDGEKAESADVRKSVENVAGGAGDDVLVGTEVANVLTGNGGNDTIFGGAGNDVLLGGDGDDTFDEESAPTGGDVIDGGNGSDTVLYAKRTAAVSILLCTDTTAANCPANCGEAGEGDTLVNVENASGGSGNDTFVGNASGNSFYGGAGDDSMEGNDGDDYLYGDDGADILHGGNGDDYLDGAKQFDMFNGGAGTGDICIIEKGEAPTACELY